MTAAIGRAGQPVEVATAVVFLASPESSYFTAQVSVVFPSSVESSIAERYSVSMPTAVLLCRFARACRHREKEYM
jgi:hypothetical protein